MVDLKPQSNNGPPWNRFVPNTTIPSKAAGIGLGAISRRQRTPIVMQRGIIGARYRTSAIEVKPSGCGEAIVMTAT